MSETSQREKLPELPRTVPDDIDTTEVEADWGNGSVEWIGGGLRGRVWTKEIAIPGYEDRYHFRLIHEYPKANGINCEIYRSEDCQFIDIIASVHFDEKLHDHEIQQEAKRMMKLAEIGAYTDSILDAFEKSRYDLH